MGRQVLTIDEVEAKAKHLSKHAWMTLGDGLGRTRASHYDDHDGNFSVLTISNALSVHRLRLERWRGGRPWSRILSEESTGKFLVLVNYGKPDVNTGETMTHTIALDFDRRLLFDSQANGPLDLTLKNFRRKTDPVPNYPNTTIVGIYRLASF